MDNQINMYIGWGFKIFSSNDLSHWINAAYIAAREQQKAEAGAFTQTTWLKGE